ncbi:MAG: hypothetical protein IJZ19_01640 [Lentisphaeria bacterium]|nr:hypothetical protein [Lentisphaeria bacterium]MBQ9775520.1 hypothetical protein [Lentisphaeria bacterium]
MKKSPLVRMSFSIEEELFNALEGLLASHGYENRSEFIRDMIRKQLTRKQCAALGEVIGTVSVLCNLAQSGVENRLNSLLDNAPVDILGSSRFAVEPNCSTTMVTARGTGPEIRELANSIRKLRGVIQAEFVITSTSK